MKSHQLGASLRAYAELAQRQGSTASAEELRRFSDIFVTGEDEAILARVNRIVKNWRACDRQARYAKTLEGQLDAIATTLSASGAATQARDVRAVLSLFDGVPTLDTASFVSEALAALLAPPRTHSSKTLSAVDDETVKQLSSELTRAVLDSQAFAEVLKKLKNTKVVSTATLGAIANRFLGDTTSYRGRKPALEAISKRQRQEATFDARRKALDKIGV